MKKEKPSKKSRILIFSDGVIQVYGGRDGNHLRVGCAVPPSKYSTFVSYVTCAGTKKDFVISFRPKSPAPEDARTFEIHNVRTTDINTSTHIEVYGYLAFDSEWF